MNLTKSSFIGDPNPNTTLLFSGTDTEQKFQKVKKTLGKDWEYTNTKISYIINSNGHRSAEISDIDLNNYILCTGCSITSGIGIPVLSRYSDIVSSSLNCDLYNLAIASTGNDVIFYNLVTWFAEVKYKPKLVIIQ